MSVFQATVDNAKNGTLLSTVLKGVTIELDGTKANLVFSRPNKDPVMAPVIQFTDGFELRDFVRGLVDDG